ncbi:hypothetical protein [Streptomyces sp. SID13031]|uniref:hypothetical protein n=1 Tax=Streptomyces sp. SID13031 TaxID=2706046 RepID=UPI0013C6A6C5|nr:hypothetical protein [Streptomyces sp. SID13031]NEA32013.1 hypothetical protein [Streptomyces sp. SID13031]
MDDQHPEAPAADTQAGRAGVVRELFDINTFYAAGKPGRLRWYAIRLGLFVLGSGIGWILWRIIDADSAGGRSFGERLLTNAYLWTCLIATAFYAIHDRRTRRQNPKG